MVIKKNFEEKPKVFLLDFLDLTFVNKGESRKEERAPWPSPDPKLIVHPIQKPPHQR